MNRNTYSKAAGKFLHFSATLQYAFTSKENHIGNGKKGKWESRVHPIVHRKQGGPQSNFEEFSNNYYVSNFAKTNGESLSVTHLKSSKTSCDSFLDLELSILVKVFAFYLVTRSL
jgi:hypothetical protein